MDQYFKDLDTLGHKYKIHAKYTDADGRYIVLFDNLAS